MIGFAPSVDETLICSKKKLYARKNTKQTESAQVLKEKGQAAGKTGDSGRIAPRGRAFASGTAAADDCRQERAPGADQPEPMAALAEHRVQFEQRR